MIRRHCDGVNGGLPVDEFLPDRTILTPLFKIPPQSLLKSISCTNMRTFLNVPVSRCDVLACELAPISALPNEACIRFTLRC